MTRRTASPIAVSAEAAFVDEGPRTGPPDGLVLDIGGDVGALIVHADASWLGFEVELTPHGQPRSHHLHTMVRRRRIADGEVVVGLFPEVLAGAYTVWDLQGEVLATVTIEGGQVTELHAHRSTAAAG